MKTLSSLAAAFLFLAALPLAAQTGTWTAVGSTGVMDESAFGLYAFGTTDLTYSPTTGSTAPIIARYNVTNTWGVSDTPPWGWLEMGYFDPNNALSVRADLFRVNRCTGAQTPICTVISVDNPSRVCGRCQITTPLNFATNLYYVQVTLTRLTPGAGTPSLFTLRIF